MARKRTEFPSRRPGRYMAGLAAVLLLLLLSSSVFALQEAATAEAVSLSAGAIHLKVGEKVQLIASASPEDAALPALKWSSSDPETVSVTSYGAVTRLREGEAVITVSASDGSGLTAVCEVYDDGLLRMEAPVELSFIAEEAWMGDLSLQAADLSGAKGLTIASRAFMNCSSLVKLILPEGVSFAEDAFTGCSQLVLYCADAAGAECAKEAGVPHVLTAVVEPEPTSGPPMNEDELPWVPAV